MRRRLDLVYGLIEIFGSLVKDSTWGLEKGGEGNSKIDGG